MTLPKTNKTFNTNQESEQCHAITANIKNAYAKCESNKSTTKISIINSDTRILGMQAGEITFALYQSYFFYEAKKIENTNG